MILALIGLLLHQNLPSRIIRALITLLEKLRTKSSLVPNHRFLCLSNWDFIETNINYVVQNSASIYLLIFMTRTLLRISSSRNYFDHNFLRLCWIESEILNEFTLLLLNDAENKQRAPTHTETDLN